MHVNSSRRRKRRRRPLATSQARKATAGSQFIRPSFELYRPAGNATPLSGPSPYGLSPIQIRQAYGFDQVTLPGTTTLADGSGQTIAIVDAYNSPNIRTDLAAFDQQFTLPNPVGDQFKIVSQTGSTTNLPGIDPSGPAPLARGISRHRSTSKSCTPWRPARASC